MGKAYVELLKDPRWQQKRLEIFARDRWACNSCGSTTSTLHVDHKRYRGKPWEAGNDDLQTLCEHCHKEITKLRREVKETLESFDESDLLKVRGFVAGVRALNGGPPPPVDLDDYGQHSLAGLLGVPYPSQAQLRAMVRRGASGSELRSFGWKCSEARLRKDEVLLALQEEAEEEVLP